MLLKTIIKLLLAAIWVCLFNCIPLVITSNFKSKTNKNDFQYLLNFLYDDSSKEFPISILLLVIGLILFLIADYFYEKYNPDESINGIVKTYLSTSLAATLLLGFLVHLIIGFTYIPKIIWLFFVKIPFERGWDILFNYKISFFQNPTIMFELYNNYSGEYEFWILLILSFFYLTSLVLVFSKSSNNLSWAYKGWEEKKLTIITYVFKLYFIYVTPAIFVWIYPIILNWFNLLPDDSYPISTTYIIGACVFLLVLLLLVFNIFRDNKKVKRELLKEEIKKEVMDEINKKL
jgi:hypothetical protein